MRRFLNRIKHAFGYLQVLRGNLTGQILGDVESGRWSLKRNRSPCLTEEHPSNEDGPIELPAAIIAADNKHTEHDQILGPQFTEGPSRFSLAKDGPRDCVALLINETFLGKLQDLFNEHRDLGLLEGSLHLAEKETSQLERLLQRAQESFETADSEEIEKDCLKILEKNGPKLRQSRQWRDELEKEYELVKSNYELSTNHTRWVLETATEDANLLGPEKPLPTILVRQEESESDEPEINESEVSEDENEIPGEVMVPQSPGTSVESDHSELSQSPGELERQEAYDHFIQLDIALDEVQDRFDNQKQNYRDQLAKYHEKCENGATGMKRSAFDRRSIQYGQQLTRALIDAEEDFERARERAYYLGAIPSDYGRECYGAEYEESWPENKTADFNASCDWGHIHAWMGDIPNSADEADNKSVEVDDWGAEEVEVNDSISMIDCEDYRQDIDRYQRQCARLEDPCAKARLLGQPDERPLERRYSF